MTHLERLATQAARTKEKLDAARTTLRQVEHKQKQLTQKARQQRRAQLGALVENAGLGDLDDTTLAGLFAVLAPLTAAPDPVAVLEGLLRDVGGLRACENGLATAAQCVASAMPV